MEQRFLHGRVYHALGHAAIQVLRLFILKTTHSHFTNISKPTHIFNVGEVKGSLFEEKFQKNVFY